MVVIFAKGGKITKFKKKHTLIPVERWGWVRTNRVGGKRVSFTHTHTHYKTNDLNERLDMGE